MADDRESRARVWFWRTWTTIGVLGLGYVAWIVLNEPLAIIVPPLGLAAVIVYVLNPVVRRLADRGVPRVAGTGIAYLGLLAAAGGGFALVAPLLAEQFSELAADAPEIAVDLQQFVNAQLARFGIDARVNLSPDADEVRAAIQRLLVGGVTGAQVAVILESAGNIARAILHATVIVVLGPVLAFYILADLPSIRRGVERVVPPDRRAEIFALAERIGSRVGGYFRGQMLVAAFVGIATSLGLLLVGLPFWALVGVLTGVFNLVPLVGPFVGGAVGVLIALTVGEGLTQALLVAAVMVVVQQIDNHVISPNVMSRTVDLHPITVMLGLLVAGSIYGILGMLVAVPVIAAAKLVLLHVLAARAPWLVDDDDEPPRQPPPPRREPAATAAGGADDA